MNPEGVSGYCQALASQFGGSWHLISWSDHVVFSNKELVLKVARQKDGIARLQNGLAAAALCHAQGLPVVAPCGDKLVEVDFGSGTLWPYIESISYDPGATGEALAPSIAGKIAETFATVGNVKIASVPWDPFARIPNRLENSSVTPALTARLRNIFEKHAPGLRQACANMPTGFAHGDALPQNVLVLRDNSMLLIDFDSAGCRPKAWDIACLQVGLRYNAGDRKAAEVALHAVDPAIEGADLAILEATKFFMATTFLLTKPGSAELEATVSAKTDALENVLKTLAI